MNKEQQEPVKAGWHVSHGELTAAASDKSISRKRESWGRGYVYNIMSKSLLVFLKTLLMLILCLLFFM